MEMPVNGECTEMSVSCVGFTYASHAPRSSFMSARTNKSLLVRKRKKKKKKERKKKTEPLQTEESK